MPKKNTAIIPRRLQRSASQPAGSAPSPKIATAGSDSGSSCENDRPHSFEIARIAVGKISIKKWSSRCATFSISACRGVGAISRLREGAFGGLRRTPGSIIAPATCTG